MLSIGEKECDKVEIHGRLDRISWHQLDMSQTQEISTQFGGSMHDEHLESSGQQQCRINYTSSTLLYLYDWPHVENIVGEYSNSDIKETTFAKFLTSRSRYLMKEQRLK